MLKKAKELTDFKHKNSPSIILIGISGFVGTAISKILIDKGQNINLPLKNQLDITNLKSIKQFILKAKPEVLINFAAYTNINNAEKERGDKKSLAWKINAEGSKNLALLCKEFNIFLIHISTDSVFPGTKNDPGPYKENDIPPITLEPLSWYSYTKLIGEQTVVNSGAKYAIVRISYPFGNFDSPKDFLVKTIKYIKSNISFFSDQTFTPTYIPDLAKAIAIIAISKKKGIYHITCTGIITPYKFAVYLGKKLGLNNKIHKQNLSDYLKKPNSIKRSKYGGLLNEITQKTLDLKLLSWQKAIDNCLDDSQFGDRNNKLTP